MRLKALWQTSRNLGSLCSQRVQDLFHAGLVWKVAGETDSEADDDSEYESEDGFVPAGHATVAWLRHKNMVGASVGDTCPEMELCSIISYVGKLHRFRHMSSVIKPMSRHEQIACC